MNKEQDEKIKNLATSVVHMAVKGTEAFLEKIRESEIKVPLEKTAAIFPETLYFYIHFLNRRELAILGNEKRNIFMDSLFVQIVKILVSNTDMNNDDAKDFSSNFTEELNERELEYGKYDFFPKKDAPLKDTLFWEFGKKILSTLDKEDDLSLLFTAITTLTDPLVDLPKSNL